jgi:hypothetical protein
MNDDIFGRIERLGFQKEYADLFAGGVERLVPAVVVGDDWDILWACLRIPLLARSRSVMKDRMPWSMHIVPGQPLSFCWVYNRLAGSPLGKIKRLMDL